MYMPDDSHRYTARLYYHGRLEQQFSGNIFSCLLAQLHLCVSTLSSGSTGTIIDKQQKKVVHSCKYNSY